MEQLARLPKTMWAALILGVLAFFVSFSSSSSTVVNGKTASCSFVDYGAIALGAIALILAIAAWRTNAGEHPSRRAPNGLMIIVTVVVVALAVWHVLDGLDVLTPVCTA